MSQSRLTTNENTITPVPAMPIAAQQPTAFPAYLQGLVEREGGFSDNPDDTGGPTNWGITLATARAYGYDGRMQELTREQASAIYLTRYWTTPKFDQLERIFPLLANKLFDIGVNMGPSAGVMYLQRALNTLNDKMHPYPDMRADGVLGPITLHALKAYILQRGEDGKRVMLNMVRAQQTVHYMELAEKDAKEATFEYGWQRLRALV